jgi:hypothetical protein
LEPTRIGEEPLAQPRLEPEGSAGGQDRRGPRRGGPPDTTVARRPRLGMPRFPFRQSWASLSAPASGIPSGSTTAEQDAIGKHSAAGTAATARKEMARALYKRSESAPPPPRRPGTHYLAPPPLPVSSGVCFPSAVFSGFRIFLLSFFPSGFAVVLGSCSSHRSLPGGFIDS